MVTAEIGITLTYDPLGRLYQVSSPAGSRRFLYDGAEVIAEYDAGGAQDHRSFLYRRRPGPGFPIKSILAYRRSLLISACAGSMMTGTRWLVLTGISLVVFIVPLAVGVPLSRLGYDYPALAYLSAAGGIAFVICLVRLIQFAIRRSWRNGA